MRCHSTTLCHSVRSCHSPDLSLKRSLVAMVILATGVPCGVYLTSGSLPRFPIRMTLLTLFMTSILLLSTANILCQWAILGVSSQYCVSLADQCFVSLIVL